MRFLPLLIAIGVLDTAVPLSSGGAAAAHAQSNTTGASATKGAPSAKPARSGPTTAPKRARTTRGSATKDSTKPAPPPRPKPVWPVNGPDPLPGSILPDKRIVAYYGNPRSTRMGILGEVRPEEMLRRLDAEVVAWTKADSTTPAIPALHLIAVVAQSAPGADGLYRARMSDSLIAMVYEWAQRRNALLFLDIQVAKSTLHAELPRLAHWFAKPNVHLGIDPEFSMKSGHAPGKRIGTMDARDVNYASEYLQELVSKHNLPPKVLVVHRFTRPMLTNYRNIRLDPRVQIVIQMDGWGSHELKKDSYLAYVYNEPVQFTGFKIFYRNDVRKKGWTLMKPEHVLALHPRPGYIQYQ
ncbi:MAG: hypothetical protein ACT4P7_12135 [Gemmatimonadaceae bacterium]